jgi:RNA polymerase sigma factor (sigma-70 family)
MVPERVIYVPSHVPATVALKVVIEAQRTMPSSNTANALTTSATFEQLAVPLLSSLYSHAYWLSRDHAEAEDLVQEAIAKSLRAFASFESGTNFKAWIFRILHNIFLTSRTGVASMRTVFLEDQPDMREIAGAEPTPEDHLIRLDDQAGVDEALDRLAPPLREILLLCDVEELKYKDIALVLDVPIGTVMSRISRARRALHALLLDRKERR